MSAPTLTRDLAWAAAQDAANTQMRAAGRSKWSQDDYRLAVETFDRLWPEERDYTGEAPTPASTSVPVCRTVLCFEGEEIELKPASAIVLCRCGHPRNRHAAYSSGTSCADCGCKAYDGAPVLPEDFANPRQRLPYQYVHHIDGDPTNNDLDNLEVRNGHADVDPERKGRDS